jgi:pantetheine-phosphate adenylyltransferase
MVTALYPGTFDPVTMGHVDITTRAAALFETIVVGVYSTPTKPLLFDIDERAKMFSSAVAHLANVQVRPYEGLTVDFAKKIGAQAVVRGLRSGSDFEYEFEMAFMNKKLAPDIESVYLMSSLEYQFVSSSVLKEVCLLGGDFSDLVPPNVKERLKESSLGQLDGR